MTSPAAARLSSTLALAWLALPHAPAAAQESAAEFPSRPITFVVPVAAGGPTDFVARVVGQSMSDTLGRSVVVENRPGAGTAIGTSLVAKAAPDGYTILAVDISLTVTPLVAANLNYDPHKELRPVSQTARSVLTLVASPDLPMRDARDLAAFARQHPDDVKAGHAGIGTPPHLAALAFAQATGTRILMVSYRGAALAVTDVVAGHITMLMTAPSTTISLTRDGKLKMLGVTGAQRLTALPEVPTLHEQGIELEGLENGVWFGIVAPAATPSGIVARLNDAVQSAVADPAVRDKLAKVDIIAQGGTPQALGMLIERQSVAWATTLRRAGVRPQ